MLRCFVWAVLTVQFVGATNCGGTENIAAACAAAEVTLDCAYLQTNAATLCAGVLSGDVMVNGPNCFLNGGGAGCGFINGSTSEWANGYLCCTDGAGAGAGAGSLSGSGSVSPSPSDSSIFLSPTPAPSYSKSATASTTCAYRSYDSQNDFSGVQGANGWYYGYYNGATFTQFTNYAVPTIGGSTTYSWNYNVASNGFISSTSIMPNAGANCNTPSYGSVTPVLRWYNPIGSCYQDITVVLYLYHVRGCGDGVNMQMKINGQTVFTQNNNAGGTISINNAYNAYNVSSIELSAGPNSGCDCDGTTYRVSIAPIGPSITALASSSMSGSLAVTTSARHSNSVTGSLAVTASARPSNSVTNSLAVTGSSRASLSSSNSPSVSRSAAVSANNSASGRGSLTTVRSPTVSASATGTATVFYTGIWTDYGAVYWNVPLSNTGSETISECMIRCSLNPTCGGISINAPCHNIALNSSDIYTTTCSNCFIIPMEGVGSGTFVSNAGWQSFIIYDKIFPPTQSVVSSRSSSRSTLSTPTWAPVAYDRNFCANSATIVLPTLGSSVVLRTNAAGGNYAVSVSCGITVTGAQNGEGFYVDFISFVTEDCCDYFSGASGGVSIFNLRGTLTPAPITIYGSSAVFGFGTDNSVVFYGVVARVTRILTSATPSVSASRSVSGTSSITRSTSVSRSSLASVSASVSARGSLEQTESQTITAVEAPSLIGTGSGRITAVEAPSLIGTGSGRITGSLGASRTATAEASSVVSFLETRSSNVTALARASAHYTGSPQASVSSSTSAHYTGSPQASVSSSTSAHYTGSPQASVSSSASAHYTASPQASVSSSASASASGSASASAIHSDSGYATIGPTATYYSTVTPSVSVTVSPISTLSLLSTLWASFSRSARASFSLSARGSSLATRSVSGSPTYVMSVTPSTTKTPGFIKPAPPPLPADLSLLSADEVLGFMNDLSNYDSSQIGESLKKLGLAGLDKINGSLSVSTESFDLQMSKVATGASGLSAGPIAIAMPPLAAVYPGAKAASLIRWTENINGGAPSDSSTISLSLLGSGGSEISVKNLSTPITLSMSLDISPSDPRFATPPTYLARCDTGILYVGTDDIYSRFTNGTVTGRGRWRVPCLLGTSADLNCSSIGLGATQTIQCPAPTIVPRCLYWNTVTKAWSSDGCLAVSGNLSQIGCACSHLTDFSARMDAVLSDNQAIFANAGNVYSLEGLLKYAQWYGVFGGLGLMTILLAVFVTRIDQASAKKYVDAICKNKYIAEILSLAPTTPVYIFDGDSTIRKKGLRSRGAWASEEDSAITTHPPLPKMNIFQRICLQHTRLHFIFRYDPRLSRIFRLLTLCLIQFNSLFVTAFFYGFTYGTGEAMKWYDVVVLALLTSGINIPIVRLILWSMEQVGQYEFMYQFPLLYFEYKRRSDFEKMAVIHLEEISENKDGMILRSTSNVNTINDQNDNGDSSGTVLNLILEYFCCRKKDTTEQDEINELKALPRPVLLRRMANIVKEAYPYIEPCLTDWSFLPCQTWRAWLFLLGACGWIAWCLNYLLLFAASHDTSVGSNVMTSYATSELTTVFISQPLTICATVGIYSLLNRYGKRLPNFLQKILMVSSVRSIPSLFYFSDPWAKSAKTAFTSEFAYNVFVKSAAAASGSNEQSYAPMKGLFLEHEPTETESKQVKDIDGLYKKMVGIWHDLQHRVRR
jgi:hypothetical protein